MVDGGVSLGKIFGIDIRLDWSWFLILMLVAWSLATGFFPQEYDFTETTYWILGVSAAVLLFLSVLFHELSHSIVAKMNKIKVESITLFFFGGVAGISPSAELKPKVELKMAAAGPLFSLALGGLFFLLSKVPLPTFFWALFDYLYKINIILGLFNLVPGYPLDGGRIVRAAMWHVTKNIQKATYYASLGGKIFGAFLVITGIFGISTGLGGGIWYILIGAFIYFLAGASYKQTIMKEALDKIHVGDVITKRYKTLPPGTTLDKFYKLCLKEGKESYMVREKGVADLIHIKRINKEDWKKVKVSQIARPVKPVKPADSVFKALEQMEKRQIRTLPVKRGNKTIGVVEADVISNILKIKELTK